MAAASTAVAVLGPTPDTRRLLDTQGSLGGEARERRAPGAEELARLLEHHGGVVSRVALELGVHRYQVYRWMAAAGRGRTGTARRTDEFRAQRSR